MFTSKFLWATSVGALLWFAVPARADDYQEWNSLGEKAERLCDAGRYREAEDYGRKLVALSERAFRNRPELVATSLEMLGRVVSEQGRYDEAEGLQKRAVALAEKAWGDGHVNVAVKLENLSAIYWKQARYAEAESLLKRVLAIREKKFGPDHADTARCLGSLGTLFIDQGRFAESEAMFKRALPIYEKALGPNNPDVATHLENFAVLLQQEARFSEAEALSQRALAIREKVLGHEHPLVGESLGNLGRIADARGRYAAAEVYDKRALAIFERAFDGRHPLIAGALVNLGATYWVQGRYDEAETLFRRAVALEESLWGPEHPQLAKTLNNLALLYRRQSRLEDAEALLQRSLAILEKRLGMEHLELSWCLTNLGRLAVDRKAYDQAQAQLQRALAIREMSLGSDHPDVARICILLADLEQRQGRAAQAEPLVDRAILLLDRAHAAPDIRYEAYELRARVQWRLHNRRDAIRDLDEALTLVEQARGESAGAEQERAGYFGRFAVAFERMVAWQTELGDAEMALAAVERGRARSLLDEMNVAGAELSIGRSGAEREQLTRREAELKTRIAELERRAGEAHDQALQAKLQRELAQARQELYDHYRDERSTSPVYRDLLSVGAGPPRLRQLQRRLLPDGELLLVYLIGEEASYVISADAHEARAGTLVIDADAARVLGIETGALTVARLLTLCANEQHSGIVEELARPEPSATLTPRLSALWKLLVPERDRDALTSGKVKRLVVVPDGPLALIPFEALVIEAAASPRYLIDAGPPVIYAPSTTVLFNLTERRSAESGAKEQSQQPVLTVGHPLYGTSGASPAGAASAPVELAARSRYSGVGGSLSDLPYSGTESSWVADAFKKQQIAVAGLREKLATEANVRSNVAGRKLLHFACHGLTDQAYGNFFGCLALTPGPKGAGDPADDGFLTLPEIYELNLKSCELAILSACQTNYGPQQKGEGVWALSRGFLVAGARRVVASNWLVDDEAAASLVSVFCSELAKAEGKHETPDYAAALDRAKKWVRGQEKWSSPYYWGTFVLVGPN